MGRLAKNCTAAAEFEGHEPLPITSESSINVINPKEGKVGSYSLPILGLEKTNNVGCVQSCSVEDSGVR